MPGIQPVDGVAGDGQKPVASSRRTDSTSRPAGWSAQIRTIVIFCVGWLPFLILWGALNSFYFDASVAEAFTSATSAMGSAAILGLVVWWISGRLPLPETEPLGFFGLQLVLAAFYSASWIGWAAFLTTLRSDLSFFEAVQSSPMVGWRFLHGMWLYGMIAGMSYVVRTQRRLQRNRELALRAQAAASQARLAQVRSQLRPHFLFNALHSVTSLMAIDVDEAQIALERLGDMLRYALEVDLDTVSLEREWRFTQQYLAIESLRLEGGLEIVASCDRAAAGIAVIPYCLQTLAENAVRHGIADRARGGRIWISARLEGEELILSVRDDGLGADLEAIASAEGRGLRLLRESLRARWGDAARLVLASDLGAGFSSVVRIPAAPAEE